MGETTSYSCDNCGAKIDDADLAVNTALRRITVALSSSSPSGATFASGQKFFCSQAHAEAWLTGLAL